MSETKHTPGPWRHRYGRIFHADRENLTIAHVARAHDGDYLPANGDVLAAAPDLLAALDAYRRWMNSTFDDLAEEFRKATGMMAPGKDQPPGYFDGADETGRKDAWSRWISERKSNLNAAALAAIQKATGETV